MEICLIPVIVAKFGAMKKSQEFYVMPDEDGGMIAQSNNYICKLDKFGKGLLCRKGSYIEPFNFPDTFTQACLKHCPPMGKMQYFDGMVEM